ncbi:MAG: HD-GYP domain-containing protein [Lachnospiraceae bacterium]|nr:HD-GYP domain-containing protein [Lachnospiraceae bacterium]
MNGILDFMLRMPVYVFELVFFVVITRKCFLEKYSFKNVVAAVLLSPVIGVLATTVIGVALFEPSSEYAKSGFVIFSIEFTLFQTACMLLLLWAYVKFVKAKNPSIALFVYLCYYQMVPNLFMVSQLNASLMSYLLPSCLIVVFYVFLVKPLSKLTRTRIVTNTKLFVILPLLTAVYNAISLTLILIMDFRILMTQDDITRFVAALRKVEDEETISFLRDLMREIIDNSEGNFTDLLYYSVLFITLILIITFVVIVRNTEYLNETLKAKDEIHELSVEVMEALARTIDAKDQYTRGHSTRVAKYARMIAEKMGLDAGKQENVYYMGLLHDIGKIAVPKEIINKPSKLSDLEYKIIQTHPAKGYEILAEIKSRPDLSIGARWHHERMDGKGYPDRKRGEEIPLEARIIAVADAYDAMTSNRSYRTYLPQEKVRDEIQKCIGTQFDEIPAKCMLEIIEEDKEYTLHE